MRAGTLLGFGLLAAYAALLVGLTFDAIVKAIGWVDILELGDLLLVLFLETSKLVTGLAALIAALLLVGHRRRAGAVALAFCLLFAAIAFVKVMDISGFPGPLQEKLAQMLLAVGTPGSLLAWLFGPLPWPAWPAAAALLRFSTVFPRQLDHAALEKGGSGGRRGFLRGSATAGADVGALFRAASHYLLRWHAYRTASLAAAAAVLVAVHTAIAGSAVATLLWLPALAITGVMITNLRAAYAMSEGADRARLAWIIEGFMLALFIFMVSAAVVILFASAAGRIAALTLVSLVPAVVMVAFARSVLQTHMHDTQQVIGRTIRFGCIAVAVAIAAGTVHLVLGVALDGLAGSRRFVAIGTAALTIMAFKPIKWLADRTRLRILEMDVFTQKGGWVE